MKKIIVFLPYENFDETTETLISNLKKVVDENTIFVTNQSQIPNRNLRRMAKDEVTSTITTAIENWNFTKSGKITQQKLMKVTGLTRSTVQANWSKFKSTVKDKNVGATKSLAIDFSIPVEKPLSTTEKMEMSDLSGCSPEFIEFLKTITY